MNNQIDYIKFYNFLKSHYKSERFEHHPACDYCPNYPELVTQSSIEQLNHVGYFCISNYESIDGKGHFYNSNFEEFNPFI